MTLACSEYADRIVQLEDGTRDVGLAVGAWSRSEECVMKRSLLLAGIAVMLIAVVNVFVFGRDPQPSAVDPDRCQGAGARDGRGPRPGGAAVRGDPGERPGRRHARVGRRR